jgi:hypothetical protein
MVARPQAELKILKHMEIAPRRALFMLTCAVLLAHLALLQSSSRSVRAGPQPSHQPFITRMVMPAAPVAVAAPVAAATTPAPVRQKPPRTAVRPGQPKATSRQTPALTVQPGPATASDFNNSTPPTNPAAQAASAEAPQAAASGTQAPADAPMVAASAATLAASAPTPQQQRLLATRYQAPAPVRIGYDVSAEAKGVPLRAQGELLWQHDGQAYTARLEIKAFLLGSRVQTSAGRITSHALAPTRFSDKVRSEVAAHFREDQGKVTFSANSPDVDLQPMAQDRLSVFMQLAGMLAAEPGKYPPGTRIAMQTIGPRSGETWEFNVEEDEALNLAGGQVTARRLLHVPAMDFDQKVELWLAPTLGYMPVRLRITQTNGDFVDLQWRTAGSP